MAAVLPILIASRTLGLNLGYPEVSLSLLADYRGSDVPHPILTWHSRSLPLSGRLWRTCHAACGISARRSNVPEIFNMQFSMFIESAQKTRLHI